MSANKTIPMKAIIDYARDYRGQLAVSQVADQKQLFQLFLTEYYRQADPEDLVDWQPADFYGAAMAHWRLMAQRKVNQPTIRIYNPRMDQDGWESSHTVIELVNDDMPFLVDSSSMEVNQQGQTLHLIIHPVLRVQRDADGNLLNVLPRDQEVPGSQLESLIHIEIDRQTNISQLQKLQDSLANVLADVRVAVEDWPLMLSTCQQLIQRSTQAALPPAEIAEGLAFLEWLADHHFTFLGYREYQLVNQDAQSILLQVVPGTGLGILREKHLEPAMSVNLATLPPEAHELIYGQHLLFLTKANSRATIHRPGYLDYLSIKKFDESGKIVGEYRFLGLFTSNAYSGNPLEIPFLRRKVQYVVQHAGFLPKSHMEKALLAILETYPRDELFQITQDELLATAMGILRLQERQRTRIFVRRDVFGRFYSFLVFIPRDKFNTENRLKIQQFLMTTFQGLSVEFTPYLTESVLARIYITVRTPLGTVVAYDTKVLEAQLLALTRRWEDDLKEALQQEFGEETGNQCLQVFHRAFPAGYREHYAAVTAVQDIQVIQGLNPQNPLGMYLYQLQTTSQEVRFKLFHLDTPLALSETLPMLEHLGMRVIDEQPYAISLVDGSVVWIHDLGLQPAGAAEDFSLAVTKPLFEEIFRQAWQKNIESDDFNQLVVSAQLNWRQILILRVYAKYFKQMGLTYSQNYIEQTLNSYPCLSRQLVELFEQRFDPAKKSLDAPAAQAKLIELIKQGIGQVSNLDQDRILRQYLETILATLRSNYYQPDAQGQVKNYLSFKFDPSKIPGLPAPKPMFEIFVYSPQMEGIHLRGGKVARGGLRWSDRREDFRTEILGLVKAQMVKNTVIVPVGSKGGFVIKNPPPASDREAFLQAGVACYRTLLRGMLDLTDNLLNGQVVPPAQVIRYDADDPYLVVAADKGTATFSDIANQISAEYGFWLGDAFASGGSVGYDHKKMGITARGAWKSVERHFRELGHNTQTQDFTVIGIGDMSGDVFGNGMLLSPHIRLLAAFDHRHIFIDPKPNSAGSHVERQRLFSLPRSSWDDYDKTLISAGGGVWPRTLKSISLSTEAQAALGVAEAEWTPNALIQAILKAPVDLFYNGGIGTYVKSSRENHQDVGDRANDAIRINGRDLRCRVVAEGGNLGFTQLGRVEAAHNGVKLNTDAIDNSAGVDCSDHEVNIKILLNSLVTQGKLRVEERNAVLADMTLEVGELVLQDNYYQTQCLSIMTRRGKDLLEGQMRLIRMLENHGILNRHLEFLPSEEELIDRKHAQKGLVGPENAILLAYSKMWVFEELVKSSLPEDPLLISTLQEYFPTLLRERYADAMMHHPLRREIVATVLTNQMTNRVGATFVHRVQEETGASAAEIVRSFVLTRKIFAFDSLWNSVDRLDQGVPDLAQGQMFIDLGRFAQRATIWFLRQRQSAVGLQTLLERYQVEFEHLRQELPRLVGPSEKTQWERQAGALVEKGVPENLARAVYATEILLSAPDLIELMHLTKYPITTIARIYYALGDCLQHNWLRNQILALPVDTHWQALARSSLRDDLAWRQRALTAAVLKLGDASGSAEQMLAQWQQQNQAALKRTTRIIADLQTLGQTDLAMLSVAIRELRNMI